MSAAATNINSIGFINHAKMAFVGNPNKLIPGQDYKPNILEKAGNFFSWHIAKLPGHIAKGLKNPKILTIAFTIAALAVVQFAFYPAATIFAVKVASAFIAANIPAWVVKVSAYTVIQTAIIGIGMRALGRFTNSDLMNKWHNLNGAANR